MLTKQIQAVASVNLDPEDVIRFVTDIRNRSKYLESLTSVSNIQGAPGEVTKSWNWKWDLLGHEFEGTGRTVDFEPGRLYSFVTEGGIQSRFTYRAEPENDGTRLWIEVDFEVPPSFADREDLDGLLTITKVRAQDSALRLKELMEQGSE